MADRSALDSTPIWVALKAPSWVALSAATAQNQGRILVVLINGYVIYAPSIDEQITSGELDVPHPISSQVLLQLQEVAQKNLKQANRT